MGKCCDYSAGMLKSSIQIGRKTRTGDGQGGVTQTWTDTAVFAYWKALSGYENFEAQRNAAVNRYRAVVRFKGDAYGAPYWGADDRVIHRNRTYQVVSVLDVEDRQQWLEITVEAGNP